MNSRIKTSVVVGILFSVFALLFIGVLGRFLYIQAKGEVANVSLKAWADEKREVSHPLYAERGKILDNTGVTLAYDRPVFNVYAIIDESYSPKGGVPRHVTDAAETAKKLAPLLNTDVKKIEKTLIDGIEKGLFQVEFGQPGRNISQKIKNEIDEEKIPGIYFAENSKRYYPNGEFASHVLGFARKDADDSPIHGVTGIEEYKNELLTGTDGHISFHRDKFGQKLLNSKEVVNEPEDGKDIHLTIDPKIQTVLEDVLNQVVESNNPERITAVVMNPKTGKIVAMSNRPSYNPNEPKNVKNWYNDIVSTPVEPGSTVKMFTWAAAIDSGNYNKNDTYLSGRYKMNPQIQPINDHKREGWGRITFDEGFKRSSNVAAARLVWEKMGPETYHKYLEAFEFDKKSGIDLPNEVAGKIQYSYPRDKVTTAFGQSSTMNIMQQLKAATAIANKGKMMKPYVIEEVTDSKTNKKLEEKEPEVISKPIKEETAEEVLDLLASVVNDKGGTGGKFKMDDYVVAGKTGTAQIPDTKKGGYLQGKEDYIFSFLGMVPRKSPELIMHVSVTKPRFNEGETGSDITSFIFKHVMENSLKYLNTEPDKKGAEVSVVEPILMPKVAGLDVEKAKEVLEEKGLDYVIIGDGKKVDETNHTHNKKILDGNQVILLTDKPKMPQLKGWSKRDVYSFSELLELELTSTGEGFVESQSIKKDTVLKKGAKLEVKFSK